MYRQNSVLFPLSAFMKAAAYSALIATSSAVVATSFTDPIDGMFDMGEYLAENAYGFLPVPVLITEPAVGYGGGFVGVFLHESEAQKEERKRLALESVEGGAQLIPPAVTIAGGAATENGTWFALLGHRRVWKEDSIRYMGGIGAGKANVDVYWNPINDLQLAIATETTGMGLLNKLQFRIADSKLLVGMNQIYAKSESKSNLGLGLDYNFLTTESVTSGVGVNFEYDALNSFFFPTSGYAVSGEYMWFDKSIGSDNSYDTFMLDGSTYFPIDEKITLALAGTYNMFSTSQTRLPPLVRPYVDLRGMPAYKYQGDYTIALQAQTMWHVTPRWTLSIFGGGGSAESEATDLFSDTTYAYGAGFRYQIARRYGIHTGLDIAFSDDDSAFYFTMGTGI